MYLNLFYFVANEWWSNALIWANLLYGNWTLVNCYSVLISFSSQALTKPSFIQQSFGINIASQPCRFLCGILDDHKKNLERKVGYIRGGGEGAKCKIPNKQLRGFRHGKRMLSAGYANTNVSNLLIWWEWMISWMTISNFGSFLDIK